MDWIPPTQTVAAVVQAVAAVVMVASLWLTKNQLKLSRELEANTFEDGFAQQYREIVHRIPIEALLGEQLSQDELTENLDDFFRYFDLCNEQTFLRQIRRIRRDTWVLWRDGMRSNFSRPAFASAWKIVSAKCPDDFHELRSLVNTGFVGDPCPTNVSLS